MADSRTDLLLTIAFSFFVFILSSLQHSDAHNITAILEKFPEYSEYNRYLTTTKLADEINDRDTLTVLVLPNSAMAGLTSKHPQPPLSVIKNVLSLHTLLDYFDAQKLHDISQGTTLSTTLYQTTGNAVGNYGFVNITDVKGGKVAFGSAAGGSRLESTYVKSVKQIPYNISVLEISDPIIAPGIMSAPGPSAAGVNITAVLEKAGCKKFASLLASSGVLKMYLAAVEKGLTVFAPSDKAFDASHLPDLNKLSSADMVTLLEYHAVPDYMTVAALKTTTAPLSTLASSSARKYALNVKSAGDSVTLTTGLDGARVASTEVDDTPLCILTIDSILLPVELFGVAPSPSPVLAPSATPVPVPSPSPSLTVSPVPVPASKAPSSVHSPPAPPMSSQAGSPASSPASSADANSSGARVSTMSPTLLGTVTVASAVGALLLARTFSSSC